MDAEASPAQVVSLTVSAGAALTALGTLFKVARWMGYTDATRDAQAARLDEIRDDVREIRALLLKERA